MIHLSDSIFGSGNNLCGAALVRGNLQTPEIPSSEKEWSKVCQACRKQFNVNSLKLKQERQERLKNIPPPTFRERVERFASFGDGSSDHYYLIPVLATHILTFGLSALIVSLGQKAAKLYLKATK